MGILRFWMRYLESKTLGELEKDFVSVNATQRETIIQFQRILYRSLIENIAFKHGSGSNDFEYKITFFLEYGFIEKHIEE